MAEKKELNHEVLEKVNGGVAKGTSLPSHGKYIPGADAKNYIGKKVYAVDDKDEDKWIFGTLKDSYDGFGTIYHTIYVEDLSDQVSTYFCDGFVQKNRDFDVRYLFVTLFLEK